MKQETFPASYRLLPVLVLLALVGIWWLVPRVYHFPEASLPTPKEVVLGFLEEIRRGSLMNDIIASLYRVTAGFLLAVISGIPFGLLLGLRLQARVAFLPTINFFRNLSPLAWIPFAVLWFGLGDSPAIFLIFMAAFFPITLATAAAVSSIPRVFFRVAEDYDLRGFTLLTQVTLPAILPQIITTLRVTSGLSWLVVVAAEMLAGREGLGYLIWDARNALRTDLVIVGMIIIGLIGVLIDRLLLQLTRIESVRWGYER